MLDLAATALNSSSRSETGRRAQGSILTTLVPNSGIQFIDFTVGEEIVAHSRRRFFEDRGEADQGPSLHVASIADGVFYHPLTNAPCNPAQTYTIDGIEALRAYAGGWLPMPFMRIAGRDGEQDTGLEEGPSNWVRAYIQPISAPGAPSAGQVAGLWHVVLAIDTAIDPAATTPPRAYASPTLDDVRSGASFRFSDDVGDVAWFATEAWVDDWLGEVFRTVRRRRAADPDDVADPGALEHLAHYLTLLTVLKEACELPALRFMEHNAVGPYAESVAVDLAMDIGSARTCVMLQERHQTRERGLARGGDERAAVRREDGRREDGRAPASATAFELAIRDLSRPWLASSGIISSRMEFSRASFGNDAFSRWSGRVHAFHWPSLVRIGPEAEHLARATTSGDNASGVSSPMHYVWDESPRSEVWRFCGSVSAATRRSPIVAGPLLAHLTESGEVLDGRDGRSITTKPRFSRSSLTTFFAAEALLHAIGMVNSPAHRQHSLRPQMARRLDRVLVTPPAGMAEAEINILRRRIEAAVRLIWRVMGWAAGADERHPLAPPEPMVVMAVDSATATQLAYVRNEVTHKFRGKADSYLALMGKPRMGGTGGRSLRLATLDVGASSTGLSVVSYETGSGGALNASRLFVDGFESGCDGVIKTIAERIVVPAIEQRLTEARIGNARRFIDALVGDDDDRRPAWIGDIGRRFAADIIVPAAEGLARLLEQPAAGGGEVTSELAIRTLVASVGADARVTAERLDVLAADEGADGFSPLDTLVPFLYRDLALIARTALTPVLSSALSVIEALDCDCVLLTGAGARLPQVIEVLLEGIPVRPDRIVSLADYRMGPWYRFADATGRVMETKRLSTLGALLHAGRAFGRAGPDLVVQPLDRARARAFIGQLDSNGLIAADAVLFATGDAGGERTRTISIEPPTLIGIRRTSLESWPAQPLFSIGLMDGVRRTPRLPLKVTVEHIPPDRGRPVQVRLVSAFDADGNRLDQSEIALGLKTRSFGEGHWLDTGRLDTAGARS